jgi:hypothetical protein
VITAMRASITFATTPAATPIAIATMAIVCKPSDGGTATRTGWTIRFDCY